MAGRRVFVFWVAPASVPVGFYRRRLPHWRLAEAIYFVTWNDGPVSRTIRGCGLLRASFRVSDKKSRHGGQRYAEKEPPQMAFIR
jgi:hypothetical protein